MIRLGVLPVLALGVASCLPEDPRPPPAKVFVSAEASVATREGFVTDDGWTIHFRRALAALGSVDLAGVDDRSDSSCNDYSRTNYDWLIDFVVAKPSKIGIVYGLGTCRVQYRLRGPTDHIVLGEGATAEDAALMSTRASELFERPRSLLIEGIAQGEDRFIVFTFLFGRTVQSERCGEEGAPTGVLHLESGESHEVRIEVRAEEIFRARASDDAPFLFGPFAAGIEGSGFIDFSTFAESEVPPEFMPDDLVDDRGQPVPPPKSLAALLYEFSVRRVTRIQGGGPCRVEPR